MDLASPNPLALNMTARRPPPLSIRVERILEKAKRNQRGIERIFHRSDQRHAKFTRNARSNYAREKRLVQATALAGRDGANENRGFNAQREQREKQQLRKGNRKKKLEARARTEDGLDKGPPHAMALDFRPWRRFRSSAETKAPEEKDDDDDATTISFDAEAMAQLDPFSRANFVGVDDDIEGKDPAGDGGGSGDEDGGSADGGGPAVAAAWRDAVADLYRDAPRMPELQCHLCGGRRKRPAADLALAAQPKLPDGWTEHRDRLWQGGDADVLLPGGKGAVFSTKTYFFREDDGSVSWRPPPGTLALGQAVFAATGSIFTRCHCPHDSAWRLVTLERLKVCKLLLPMKVATAGGKSSRIKYVCCSTYYEEVWSNDIEVREAAITIQKEIRGHQARRALTRHILKKKSGRQMSRRELSPLPDHRELSRHQRLTEQSSD